MTEADIAEPTQQSTDLIGLMAMIHGATTCPSHERQFANFALALLLDKERFEVGGRKPTHTEFGFSIFASKLPRSLTDNIWLHFCWQPSEDSGLAALNRFLS